jgi:hypothetical protein
VNLKRNKSNALGLLAGGVFLFAVGAYTDNGGFRFAGGILLVVSAVLALQQPSKRPGDT